MNIHGWIIYPEYVSRHSDNAFDWLKDEAAACGITLDILFSEDIEICYGSERFIKHKGCKVDIMPDFVLIRTYDSVISRFFESNSIPVINSGESMELSKNKMLTHELLSATGIPTPFTVYKEGARYNYAELCEMFNSEQFIVKRIDGAKGEDVYLAKDEQQMKAAIESCGGRCICQQFIEASSGCDVRVWVVGKRAVGAVLRYSETSFLSNFSQGGQVKPFELTSEAAELAVAGCRTLGIEFAGVDLLFTDNGFTINEINGNAGFRTLSRVGKNTIPKELFGYIKLRVSKKPSLHRL